MIHNKYIVIVDGGENVQLWTVGANRENWPRTVDKQWSPSLWITQKKTQPVS
jgi:hypothetical protein